MKKNVIAAAMAAMGLAMMLTACGGGDSASSASSTSAATEAADKEQTEEAQAADSAASDAGEAPEKPDGSTPMGLLTGIRRKSLTESRARRARRVPRSRIPQSERLTGICLVSIWKERSKYEEKEPVSGTGRKPVPVPFYHCMRKLCIQQHRCHSGSSRERGDGKQRYCRCRIRRRTGGCPGSAWRCPLRGKA